MFGSGLRHSVPSTAGGGALQKVLQHVRKRSLLRHRLHLPCSRWGAVDRPGTVHLLPGLERRRAAVSIPHVGHGPVADFGRGLFPADAIHLRIGQTSAQLGRAALRGQHPRRCGSGGGASGG